MNPNPVHWKSGLMSVNPRKLQEYPVTLEYVVSSHDQRILEFGVRRIADSYDAQMVLSYDLWDMPLTSAEPENCSVDYDCIDHSQLPKALQLLYDDFEVDDYRQFVQRMSSFDVIGVYFMEKLMGIKRG